MTGFSTQSQAIEPCPVGAGGISYRDICGLVLQAEIVARGPHEWLGRRKLAQKLALFNQGQMVSVARVPGVARMLWQAAVLLAESDEREIREMAASTIKCISPLKWRGFQSPLQEKRRRGDLG